MIFQELDTQELYEELRSSREQGLLSDAVIAIDSSPKIQDAFFQQSSGNYMPILHDTAYATMWSVMPYLRRLNENSAFLVTLIDAQCDWGFLSLSRADLMLHCQHWQSLCEVVSPAGTKFFFRFQDTATVRRMIPTFTEQELIWFMGPAESLVIPSRDVDGNRIWLLVKNPWLCRNKEDILTNYHPAAMPWWEVREEHLVPFPKEKDAALKHNLSCKLRDERPHAAMLINSRYNGLDNGLDKFIQQARCFGLKNDGHVETFVGLCATLPPDRLNNEAMQKAMFNATETPNIALQRLSLLMLDR